MFVVVVAVVLVAGRVAAQGAIPPASAPIAYPGIPSVPYSTQWQQYFKVNNSLLNLSFEPPSSYAGNIQTARPGHDDDSLFFWAFEKQSGSLVNATSTDPWLIWLNGGPGSSSMLGLLLENGPIHINDFSTDESPHANQFSWHTLSDIFYIDQPVGTGYATADSDGYADDQEQVAEDFVGFLQNVVKVFPQLASRPLIFTGESYSGRFIPYISRALLTHSNPPVQLSRIALGDATIGSLILHHHAPVVTLLQTYPQLINYNASTLEFYLQQSSLCGYNLSLTYPQSGGHFPPLKDQPPTAVGRVIESFIAAKPIRRLRSTRPSPWGLRKRSPHSRYHDAPPPPKPDANVTIDPWYGCYLLDSIADYAVNFSFPYATGIDLYDAPDGGEDLPLNRGIRTFLNDDSVRTAIHAPNKLWAPMTDFPFADGSDDPSPEPDFFGNLIEMVEKVVLYSGNDDLLDSHRGTEIVIQNTTWAGQQGFVKPPQTEWHIDGVEGGVSGVVHQERGLAYVLIRGAGHQVPLFQPNLALELLRQFILGDNDLGTVALNGSVIGKENDKLHPVLRGQDAINYVDDALQATSTIWPHTSRQAWDQAVETLAPL